MAGHDVIEMMCIAAWKHYSRMRRGFSWMRLQECDRIAFRAGMTAAVRLAQDAGDLVSASHGGRANGPYYIASFDGSRRWSYHDGQRWHDGFESPEAALADAMGQKSNDTYDLAEDQ